MAAEALQVLQPHRSLYLRGVDRRGAAAAIVDASATGWKLSMAARDQADFAVVVLHDAYDRFGHIGSTRYLPEFSLAGVTLEFDLAIDGLQHPVSRKFQSVPWGALSWVKPDESTGTTELQPLATSATGMAAASRTWTVEGAPVAFDRVYLVYLGNVVFDYIVSGGDTTAVVASALRAAINGASWAGVGATAALIATGNGADVTVTAARYGVVDVAGTAVSFVSGQNFLGCVAGDAICLGGTLYEIDAVSGPGALTLTTSAGTASGVAYTAPGGGRDGNAIELIEMHKTATTYLTPAGSSKLAGGSDPVSTHFAIDFTVAGLGSVRQVWMTFAPSLNYDDGAGTPALAAYAAAECSAVFSSWAVTSATALKVAGHGSVTIGTRDQWLQRSGAWAEWEGFYYRGFALANAAAGATITVRYSCQYVHDLYVGASLRPSGGKMTSTVDGGAAATVDTYVRDAGETAGRLLIASGVAAGSHVVVLTVSAAKNAASSGWDCVVEYVQAARRTDVQDPEVVYADVNAACDFDTPATGALAPSRLAFLLERMGFAGDIDFYTGVFYALNRTRVGGHFRSAVMTLSGTFATGSGFGDGDAIFLEVGGTAFGAAVYPADDVDTLAQRFVDGVNALFVGVRAEKTGAGELTITQLSPINGFAVSATYAGAASVTLTGDLDTGNEGVWGVDAAAPVPLNRAFADWMEDWCAVLAAAGRTMTWSFSQELLAPPDQDTAADAWVQRFADGSTVLTATGFGSWGAGVVESIAGSVVEQSGHGYTTGYRVHVAGAGSGVWIVTVVDADHYELTRLVSGGYTPVAGDAVLAELQTSHCAFSAAVAAYLSACYVQAAQIMDAAGLAVWLQFGEMLHWYFSRVQGLEIASVSNAAGLVRVETAVAHGLATGERVIAAGVRGVPVNGLWAITVVDATRFTLDGSTWSGAYVGGGTVSGGGMALYDASQAAAALAGLGRALEAFYTQADDPSVNSGADAVFLRGRLLDQVEAIRSAVLGAVPGAQFELLGAGDVTRGACYYTADLPYPQGGALNRAINWPLEFLSPGSAPFERIRMEALSWGATYRNLDLSREALRFAEVEGSWDRSQVMVLIPWFNGGCPWEREYRLWRELRQAGACFWAVDHGSLHGWSVPALVSEARSRVQTV